MRRALSAALTAFLAASLLLAGPPATADPTATPAADQPVSTFTPRSPVRVLDTRTGTGPVGAGRVVTLDLATHVPATATAVVFNVTGVTPTAATYITVFPAGTSESTASSLNLATGDTRANQVTVALGTNRKVGFYNNDGNVHIVADLAGHYATGAGGKFTALPPGRLLDTRSAGGAVGPGATRVVDLADRVPASATAVTFNMTATNPTAATFVTAWPTGTTRPNASNLNITASDTRPNLVTVAIGADRRVSLYNNAGTVDLIVDVTGFYTPDYGASFVPMNPTRVLDTRNGTGTDGATSPVGPAASIEVDLDDLPITSTGVIVNITGVGATTATYVTAWGAFQPPPNASTLNLSPGQINANAATIAFGQLPGLQLYNDAGTVHLVADLAGVFAVLDEPTCTADCVYAWGRNSDQALGTAETTSFAYVPTQVVALSGVHAVDGGSWQNGFAVRHDGSVWAWGNNERGQLGNGWASPGSGGGSEVPVPVLGLSGATAVAGSNYGAYALRDDGTVWAWGSGVAGRLGTGSTPDHTSVPVQVSGLTGMVAIDSGWATGYALRGDGTVWAWGFNGSGALGNGSTADSSAVPVQVPGLTGITAIAGRDNGGYTLAGDGTVWAWGDNGAGQLGNGQPCDPAPSVSCMSRVPVRVAELTGVTGIAGGVNNGYAVRDDGTAWSWGSNYEGALGNGVRCDPTAETCESRVPVQVSNLSDVTQVAGFDFGGYALRADGSVWGWGSNQWGAIGDNAPRVAVVPWTIPGVTGVSAVGSGWDTGYAIVPAPQS